MSKWLLVVLFALIQFQTWADPILIGLHCQSTYLRCTISPAQGSYQVVGDDKILFTVSTGQTADMTAMVKSTFSIPEKTTRDTKR
jgi:hypothetical protein